MVKVLRFVTMRSCLLIIHEDAFAFKVSVVLTILKHGCRACCKAECAASSDASSQCTACVLRAGLELPCTFMSSIQMCTDAYDIIRDVHFTVYSSAVILS